MTYPCVKIIKVPILCMIESKKLKVPDTILMNLIIKEIFISYHMVKILCQSQ